MTDDRVAPDQARPCDEHDAHYGSGLRCQGNPGHDGPHFHDGAAWPNGAPHPVAACNALVRRSPSEVKAYQDGYAAAMRAVARWAEGQGDLIEATKLVEGVTPNV